MEEIKITHIEEIEIENLWGLYDIKWQLDPKVNILIGINGSGKSTVLNVIETLLVEDVPLEGFEKNVLSLVKIGFNDGKFLLQDGHLYDKNYNIFRYEDLINLSKVSTFDNPSDDDGERESVAKSNVRTALDFELYNAINDFKSYQLTLSKQEKRETAKLEDKIKRLIQNKSSHKEDLQQIGILYKQIEDLRANIYARRDLLISFISVLFSETNKIVDFDEHNSFVFHIGKNTIKPHQLSTGEKQILLILLCVVVQNGEPYILVMDEPEISLHFSWQIKLIDMICGLNKNCQVIIATHAPEIFSKGWKNKVVKMENITFKSKNR